MDLLLFVAGTVILFLSGDLLVKAAISLSLRLTISPGIVGLTIIAFGTSAPELIVGLQAAWSGSAGLALGNIIGSNIANIFLILGIPALIINIKSSDPSLTKTYSYMACATILFLFFLTFSGLNFWHGLIFLGLLILFIINSILNISSSENLNDETTLELEKVNPKALRLIIFLGVGFIGLPLGANLLVTGATGFARSFGVTEELIGLTIVALGTSLPEISTSISAAFRKEVNLLIGNVIGSNMFNILGISGAVSLITPLTLSVDIEIVSLIVLILSVLILYPFIVLRKEINRFLGSAFITLYITYIAMLI